MEHSHPTTASDSPVAIATSTSAITDLLSGAYKLIATVRKDTPLRLSRRHSRVISPSPSSGRRVSTAFRRMSTAVSQVSGRRSSVAARESTRTSNAESIAEHDVDQHHAQPGEQRVSTAFRRMSSAVAQVSGRHSSVAARDSTRTSNAESIMEHDVDQPDAQPGGELRASGLGNLISRAADRRSSEKSVDEPSPVAARSRKRGSVTIFNKTSRTQADKIKARQRLRWNPKVRQAAKRLWLAAKIHQGGMRRDEYLDFHLSAYRYLLNMDGTSSDPSAGDPVLAFDAETFDEDDARQAGLDDWATDVPPGFQTLSCDAFVDAIFQLADLYVDTINPRDYQQFVAELYRGCVDKDKDGAPSWRHRWPRDENATSSSTWPVPAADDRRFSSKMKLRSGWNLLGIQVAAARVAPPSPVAVAA